MHAISKLNKNKVIEVFNKMDYGDAMEKTNLAELWLLKRYMKFEESSENVVLVKNVLKGNVAATVKLGCEADSSPDVETTMKYNNALEKLNFFNEIINELKKHIELIVQLEMCIRGFSRRDTMKSLKLFFEYLEYYSTFNGVPSKYYCALPVRNSSLSLFGYYIGCTLSASKHTNIEIQPREFVIMKTIFELISIQCDKYGVIAEFRVTETQTYLVPNVKTPVLIFNGADLDSACDSVVNAAWSEQGQMPWSVNTVFVQEDILTDFTLKCKNKLKIVKFGSSNNRQVDFSYPYLIDNFQSKYETTISDAKSKGIKIYQPNVNSKEFQPTLFCGGKVYSNNVLTPSEPRVPYLNVLGFRSIKEGIDLCNNQKQTFAASVWADNVGLVTELVQSLNVGTVWINTHGVFKANIPYYISSGKIIGHQHQGLFANYLFFTNNEEATIAKLKSDQLAWSKKTREERIQVFKNVAQKLVQVIKESVAKDVLESWMDVLLDYPVKETSLSKVRIYDSFELKQMNEPMGVIYYLPNKRTSDVDKRKHIISALLNGNSMVLHFDHKIKKDEYEVVREFTAQMQGLVILITGDCSLRMGQLDSNEMGGMYCCNLHDEFYRSLIDFNFCKFKNVWTSIGENYV